jgi:hypothetical protein
MARARRDTHNADTWPGFVDALATLLLVIIFLLVVFVLAQFFLNQLLQGKPVERSLYQLLIRMAIVLGYAHLNVTISTNGCNHRDFVQAVSEFWVR